MTALATSLVVLAKAPRAGHVKTRLQPEFSAAEAAGLAAAALQDTLAAVRRSPARRRILALDGDGEGLAPGFTIRAQAPGGLDRRLAAAFAGCPGDGPALLIGMDTPQVQPRNLIVDFGDVDAVLGLSEDGGFWAVGLTPDVDPWAVFPGVPMSTARTGAAQLARMVALGLRVRLLAPQRDVDTADDADAVASAHPHLRFSRLHDRIVAGRSVQPPNRLFDLAFRDRPVAVTAGRLDLRTERWCRPADPVDLMVAARCEAPVVDLGCGPGRMLVALQQRGISALGVDTSTIAVRRARESGSVALRRDLGAPLPAEGRWGTVLLMDGNVGIDGAPARILARCRDLLRPQGLVVCEADPDPSRDETTEVVLSSTTARSAPIAWSHAGVVALTRAAAAAGLAATEHWTLGGRVFLAFRRPA